MDLGSKVGITTVNNPLFYLPSKFKEKEKSGGRRTQRDGGKSTTKEDQKGLKNPTRTHRGKAGTPTRECPPGRCSNGYLAAPTPAQWEQLCALAFDSSRKGKHIHASSTMQV